MSSLYYTNEILIYTEINKSFFWIKDLINKQPVSFAFPGGKTSEYAIKKVFESGYLVARTTELFSKKIKDEKSLMPTTLQVYQHDKTTYIKHLAKRKRIFNLLKWLQKGSENNLYKLAEQFIIDIDKSGGCFHLWGHSWEIEQQNLWKKLEDIFKIISFQTGFKYLTNGETAA